MNEFMTRLIVVLMLLLFVVCMGCNSTTAIPAPGTHTPLIASVAGLVTASDGTPAPNPPTPPVPSGVCDNCKGTGKLGDGTVSVPCPVCGGDGRTDNEPPPAPKPKEVPRVDPVPPIASYQDAVKAFDGMCVDGNCDKPAATATQSQRTVETQNNSPRRGLFRRRRGGGGG